MLALAARNSILELVRPTPLVKLASIPGAQHAAIFLKLEHLNPTGSHKDRIARAMLERAKTEGRLAANGTVIEASCGNLGVALALACAAGGYRLIVAMPQFVPPEFRALIKAYGARVELTPAELGMSGAIARARELLSRTPGAYLPAQYDNPVNLETHQRTTGAELVRAMELRGTRPSAFVMTVATGGTLGGVGKALRQVFPDIQLVAVEIVGSPGAARSGPIALSGRATGQLFPGSHLVADRVIELEEAAARQMARQLAREEGLLVGTSTGANVLAAQQLARLLGPGDSVYTLCCDSGERYFSVEEAHR